MYELIEGLHGTEVIADGFTVVGFEDTLEEAMSDHDKNLDEFLLHCKERRSDSIWTRYSSGSRRCHLLDM